MGTSATDLSLPRNGKYRKISIFCSTQASSLTIYASQYLPFLNFYKYEAETEQYWGIVTERERERERDTEREGDEQLIERETEVLL